MKRLRIVAVLSSLLVSSSLLGGGPAGAAPNPPGAAAKSPGAEPAAARPVPKAAPPADTVDPARRDALLPRGWRTSGDVAWTTSGDSDGFHLLAATAESGYTWRTVATLAEPGFETDQWIGNACLTASGRRVVVVYGPRTFTNRPDLFDRGGFVAVVDLDTSAVTKLAVQGSLAYFNPGCGSGERAVVTQFAGERADNPTGRAESRIVTVDAAAGTAAEPVLIGTEVFAAVPVGGAVVAAAAGGLVRVGAGGRLHRLAGAAGVPFRLTADAGGGVVYLERAGDRVRVRRTMPAGGAAATILAEGGRGDVTVTAGSGGRVFLTGRPERVAALPAGVHRVDAPAGTPVSSHGGVALTRVRWAGIADPRAVPAVDAPRDVIVEAKVLDTGAALTFRVAPEATGARAAAGRAVHPKLAGSKRPAGGPTKRAGGPDAQVGSPSEPVEDERYCSVPRNDPRNQAMQPKPRQVEWAVDQAVTGSLTVVRPANWKNLGMPSYTPQGLFPPLALEGGGRVPAQVMLGIIAQESNMWQAPGFALPGVTANPLIGNYYGREIYDLGEANDWDIHWDKADCGYGVAQITDGMRRAGREKPGETALPYDTQRAVALDFAANVAAGVRILQDKWNQTRRGGLFVHDGDPEFVENWFFALWAYNSGFYPNQGDGQPWGVGWANNPINPRYDPDRPPFLEESYDDARTPQFWPYPEKVLGWAGHPVEIPESPQVLVHGYRAAWWSSDGARAQVQPPAEVFCRPSNDCYPGQSWQPDAPDVEEEPPGPCGHRNSAGQYDLRCWFHEPVGWKSVLPGHGLPCLNCGNELLRFDPGYPYQEDGTSFPPKCETDDMPNALIIDDVRDEFPSIRPDCPRRWTNAGTFALTFAADSQGNYSSKVDFHQLGAGFGGHLWRAHTRTAGDLGGKMKVTATWRLSQSRTGWHKIKIALPDHGAWTRQADYVINLGNGQTRHRVVNQVWQAHKWIDLGSFNLAGNASVTLTTVTSDGTGDDNIVFDAVAFVPTGAPQANYVAMGDSFSSGEGLQPYDVNSDYVHAIGNREDRNACHRSQQGAYPRMVTLPGHPKPIAQHAVEGTASFAFIACSGAMTTSITSDAVNNPPTVDDLGGHTDWGQPDQRFGEVAQVDQGWLDVGTTHVTLSVGGNDVRFTDVMRGCILSIGSCYADDYYLTRGNGEVDPQPLKTYEKRVITEMLPRHLQAVYRAIHAKAANAKIYVLGYPRMFPDNPVTGCSTAISVDTQRFLNTLADMLTITIADAVHDVRREGVDITFVEPTARWRIGTGPNAHWMCPDQPSSWLNAVTGPSTSGSGTNTPGVGTFHPNAAGQQAFADLMNRALRGPSSVTAVRDRISAYVATRAADGWAITPAQAQHAAERCLDLTRHAGLVTDPCMTVPILFPTIANAAGPARNDDDALVRNPPWVQLHYVSGTEKNKVLRAGWMDRARYRPNPCPLQRPTDQCDEYPFRTSEEGGAWDDFRGYDSPVSTRLRMVPAPENGIEGSTLGAMYGVCRMTSGTYAVIGQLLTSNGDPYLTIPLLSGTPPRTLYVC
jgi:hypothetical protein